MRRERTNKKRADRASLEQSEIMQEGGNENVVKGVSRRIIVVPSPDPELFEQAIFVVREDRAGEKGVSEQEILAQARQAAGGFGFREKRSLRESAAGPLYAAAGAVTAALAWLAVHATGILG